jgi:hypothetical protein
LGCGRAISRHIQNEKNERTDLKETNNAQEKLTQQVTHVSLAVSLRVSRLQLFELQVTRLVVVMMLFT